MYAYVFCTRQYLLSTAMGFVKWRYPWLTEGVRPLRSHVLFPPYKKCTVIKDGLPRRDNLLEKYSPVNYAARCVHSNARRAIVPIKTKLGSPGMMNAQAACLTQVRRGVLIGCRQLA